MLCFDSEQRGQTGRQKAHNKQISRQTSRQRRKQKRSVKWPFYLQEVFGGDSRGTVAGLAKSLGYTVAQHYRFMIRTFFADGSLLGATGRAMMSRRAVPPAFLDAIFLTMRKPRCSDSLALHPLCKCMGAYLSPANLCGGASSMKRCLEWRVHYMLHPFSLWLALLSLAHES